MAKDKKKKEPVGGTKKELVIVTRPVVTRDKVEKDEKKRRILVIIKAMEDQGGIYERSLAHLVHWLQSEKGIDLGYQFYVVGDVPTSKELHEDVVALLYVGLAETDPRTKKLRLTSEGREFVSKLEGEEYEKLVEAVEEYKPKIAALDAQIELTTMLQRPRPRRRRF